MASKLPEPYQMRATPGSQLDPKDVIGRDDDIIRLWERLKYTSVRLNVPRRFGKTSVLNRMTVEPPPDWLATKISLQGIVTTNDFAVTLLDHLSGFNTLPGKALGILKSFLDRSQAQAKVGPFTWALAPAFRNQPLTALQVALSKLSESLHEQDLRLLVACDEVPDMLLAIADKEGTSAACQVLATLRQFRDGELNSSVRWVLTGSVGMHHVLTKIGGRDDLLNDLESYPLGPLDAQWSAWLAECLLLGAGIEYEPATTTEIARVTDCIPYLAHLVVAYARDNSGKSELPPENVNAVFEKAVSDLDASHQSTHLLTRLGPYYGEETATAETLLDHLALGHQSRSELEASLQTDSKVLVDNRQLRRLLELLTLDHYVEQDIAGIYQWRYPALARIWQVRRR